MCATKLSLPPQIGGLLQHAPKGRGSLNLALQCRTIQWIIQNGLQLPYWDRGAVQPVFCCTRCCTCFHAEGLTGYHTRGLFVTHDKLPKNVRVATHFFRRLYFLPLSGHTNLVEGDILGDAPVSQRRRRAPLPPSALILCVPYSVHGLLQQSSLDTMLALRCPIHFNPNATFLPEAKAECDDIHHPLGQPPS